MFISMKLSPEAKAILATDLRRKIAHVEASMATLDSELSAMRELLVYATAALASQTSRLGYVRGLPPRV